jgi:hypothetical protein
VEQCACKTTSIGSVALLLVAAYEWKSYKHCLPIPLVEPCCQLSVSVFSALLWMRIREGIKLYL